MNDKGKSRMNLVEIQDETREEAIANFEQSLYNEVDVMATKQMQVEVRTQSGKQIKEMARDKGAKKCRRRRLGLHDFLILKNEGLYPILDDVDLKIWISQLDNP